MPSLSSRRLSLAAAAVVGLSGVGVLPLAASAAPLPSGYAAGSVVLLSQFSGTLNVGDDGTGTNTVRLEAGAEPTVARMIFQFRTTPQPPLPSPWTTIATVERNDDGAFATEWAAPTPTLGQTYDVRAVPADATGTALAGFTPATRTELARTSARAVNLTNATDLGYFVVQAGPEKDKLLASVSGSTGAFDQNNEARALRIGLFDPTGQRVTTPRGAIDSVPAGAFTTKVDLSSVTIDSTAAAVNQVALWSAIYTNNTPDGNISADEVEAYTLYQQSITTVTAVPDRSNVAPGESAAVTVTVVDGKGKPVVGAQVMRQGSGTPTPTPTEVGFTGARGTVTVPQPGGTTASYYANADAAAAFSSAAGDKRSPDVTVTNVPTTPTSLAATSADGSAFDLDEVDNTPSTGTGNDGDATDVTVQVRDQRGADMSAGSSQVLQYHWTVTPFGGGTPTRFPATGSSTGSPEGGGEFSVVVPAGGNGTYELFAGLTEDTITTGGAIASSKVLTVRAGQAAITWDRTSPQEAPAGATSQVTGRLALPDGTGLPGRDLALTFQRDTNTADEDPTPDAGFSVNGGVALNTTVTTAANGAFSASVTDPAESPQLQELGDNIDAASATNSFGNAGATRNDQVVNFVVDTTPTAVTLTESRESATLRPGEFTLYTVKVANRLGGGIAGQDVTLSTDKGYFSLDDGSALTTAPTAAPAPATGADAGTYRDDGRSVTLETGSDGTATVFLAMGRDTGFDDDGQVVSRVTATLGSLSARDDHAWTSSNPLNGGTVTVVPSDRAQQSAILPKAQTNDQVFVDVELTDQFGNAVGGENVTLTDDSVTGSIAETDGVANDGTIISDFTREGDATLSTTSEAAQTVTASWTTERTSYTGAGSTTTTGTETLTGTYTVEWYAVDYAASDITLTPDRSGARAVGSSATLTYEALDQLGQPISDLFVAFTRSGPGAGSDTSGSSDTLTGADGRATYTFVGSLPGRADVTATARQGSATGDVVTGASRTASVTFEEERVEPVKPRIETVKRVRGDKLVLRVTVTASTQDPVQGSLVLKEGGKRLAGGDLNADGKRKLVVRGLDQGFTSLRLVFKGNDVVRKQSRTINVNIR